MLLRTLVRHAYDNVPHYRRLLDPALVRRLQSARDLADFPVLDRTDLHGEAGDELLAAGFTPDNTRAATTSGSSGIPITIRNSERDLGYLRATYLQDMLSNGLRPADRIAYFRVNPFLRHPLERFGVLRNFHIPTGRSLDEQVAAFLAARPTFLIGFPNVIRSVVDELRRRGVQHRGYGPCCSAANGCRRRRGRRSSTTSARPTGRCTPPSRSSPSPVPAARGAAPALGRPGGGGGARGRDRLGGGRRR